MPTPGLLEPLGDRPLGRDTSATVAHWKAILPTMPAAPAIMRGVLPRKSPDIARFINPRPHHQTIGNCVGRSGARMIETLLRIPDNATAASTPLPAVDISALWVYWQARHEARLQGVPLDPEPPGGAVVSHSLAAMQARGLVARDLWLDDATHEARYTDSLQPTQNMNQFGTQHLVKSRALLTSFEQILEYLAAGYAVQNGQPITDGWLQTDDQGHFRDAGRVIGGHATCFISYDMDTGTMGVLNSWNRWGYIDRGDPRFRDQEGYSNIGFIPLEVIEAKFNQSSIQQGEVEAVVANTVEGFDRPKIEYDFRSLYGSVDTSDLA